VHGVFPSTCNQFRICTEISISPRQYWRQWESRYTIHAGRNLPDKEFRYLRTVKVTAAVYLGLKSMRTTFQFIYKAPGRPQTQYIIKYFAESCVFIKQSLSPILCQPHIAVPLCPEVTESICRVPSILLSNILIFYQIPVSVLVRILLFFFPDRKI